MIKLRTDNTDISGRETTLTFDAGTGTLRIEKLSPQIKDLDSVLGFTCLDDNGEKCRLGYTAGHGEPGKYYFYDAEGNRTQIKKIDLTAKGCPKSELSFRRPADVTLEIFHGTDITVRCGMKLDVHVRAADGHRLGVARGLSFDDNPDPYVSREDMTFNTKELMQKITEITADGYGTKLQTGKEDINIGPFEVLSGKGMHSFLSFENKKGEKRMLFIDNKMVRGISLAAARRNERYEMKKAEKFAGLYKALEPTCRNQREREVLQRHIFAGDDIMGIPIAEAVENPEEAVRRMKIYQDSPTMMMAFTKNISTLSNREMRALTTGTGTTHDLSEAMRKLSEMTVRLDGHNGTDGYRLASKDEDGTITLHDDEFEHIKGSYKDSYELQRRELLAKFSLAFKDTLESENFKEFAAYCKEQKCDILEAARVTENEEMLWEKVAEMNDPALFCELVNASPSFRGNKEVNPEVAMTVYEMLQGGCFELDAPSYRNTNLINTLKRASLFYDIMSARETNLDKNEAMELTEAYLWGKAELTASDMHKLAEAKGVRRVDAIKEYLLEGDERLLENSIKYNGRYAQEMMEKFLEKATTDGVKRMSNDPENAEITREVITDPLELINEFNNTNRMGCRITSLGDSLLSYTVPIVGGLFAESFEEVAPEHTELSKLANIEYRIDMNIIEAYKHENYTYEEVEPVKTSEEENLEYTPDEEFDEDFEVDYYEVYR